MITLSLQKCSARAMGYEKREAIHALEHEKKKEKE
jgi:hypothetical protein